MNSVNAATQLQPLFNGASNTETTSTSSGPSTSSGLSSDFETFLKMLTVQMQNQDPLNPVDSADYAVQLATFSSVEQQVLTNDLLTALTASMAGGGIGALGQWVGMDVRAGNQGHYDGDPIDMVVPEHEGADRRVLVIRDGLGEIAGRLDIPLSGSDVSWEGRMADGTQADPGLYDFSVEAYKDGAVQATDPALVYSEVKEARIDNGVTQLVLQGGIVLPPSEVTGLRGKE